MSLSIKITPNTDIPLELLSQEQLDFLKDRLTIDNPKYLEASKRGARLYGIDKHIKLYREDSIFIHIPRSFLFAEEPLPDVQKIKTDIINTLIESEALVVSKQEPTPSIIASSSNITLRDNQKEFLDFGRLLSPASSFYKSYTDTQKYFDLAMDDLILNVPCGKGKTVMALYLLNKAHFLRNIVLVPTKALAKQWCRRIKSCLPEHRYLFIDDKELNNLRKATKDKDYNLLIPEFYTQTSNPTIIVATYETMLILLTEIPGLMAIYSVGFTAFDEAHRIPTESFLPVLEKLRSRKRVGLTATLRRSDSNIAPLIYHLGATVLTMKQTVDDFAMYINCRTPYTYSTLVNKKKLPTGTTIETWRDFLTAGDELRFLDYGETPSCFYVTYDSKIFDSDSKRKEFRYLKATQGKPVSTALEESFLSEYPKRLKTTVSIINKCLKVGRKILVLSSRLYNLKKLHAYYTLIGVPSALVIGGSDIDNDQEEYYLNNVAKIIFGSNALAKEGLDVESLDTVVTTTPLVDTEQAVGRTTRTFPGKKKPLYIAITDSTSYSYGITRKSLDFLEINTHKAHTPKSVDLKQALQLIETIK